MNFDDIRKYIEEAGFVFLGAFHREERTGITETLMLIGNAGPAMWGNFNTSCDIENTTLDKWTRSTVTKLARQTGAIALFPFDKPPHPFLSWAEKSGETFTSPIGLSIHPVYGLWHGYRAALIFEGQLALPPKQQTNSPCDSCEEKPCLTTCPVNAFTPTGYDVPACVAHIKTTDKPDCLELGCRARRACPVGKDYHYSPQQARFHMSSFVDSNG